MSKDTPMTTELEEESTPMSDPSRQGGPDNYTLEGTDGVDTELLARDVVHLTWDLKGLNSCAIDVRGRVSYTDFVIVCTATADRHVQAIARHVMNSLGAAGFDSLGSEGLDSGNWALVDFGDVVLHIFNGEARREYDLERVWVDAPKLEFEDAPKDLYGHFELQQF
ncbi:ribosome silencing factor [Bradymonas sediminis]|uniref:Ribosomal silencing factor RsfS n=2 Tax=Bradymonas sediminis TaxID=1548548 RepID=A0A2Z4FKR8_9DELT|nr:ribosome silencing factor [Bradymonas sediminis]AWV89298.1 ribosome silencing factor [Bradymonas sediminis]TDP73471.1 ribosome silencing factor RsfS/YbeB/iojap [Bradymonas sediminis]